MNPRNGRAHSILLFHLSIVVSGMLSLAPLLAAGNPAAVPASRDEALAIVQNKFKKYAGKHVDIIFDGDSITNRWEDVGAQSWTQYAKRSANFGIEGDRVENDLWRLSKGQVDGMDPKLVVLMIGTNNISAGFAPDQIADGIKALVAEYEKRCPQAHIVLMGIFPRGANSTDEKRMAVAMVNGKIKALDDGSRVSFLDIGAQLTEHDSTFSANVMNNDFVHPKAGGYLIWSRAIQPLVAKYAPPASE